MLSNSGGPLTQGHDFCTWHATLIWGATKQSFIQVDHKQNGYGPEGGLKKKVNCDLDLWPKVTISAHDTNSWYDKQPCNVLLLELKLIQISRS